MAEIPHKAIADAMELISWPVEEGWIQYLTVEVYRPRLKRLFVADDDPYVRLHGARSFGSQLQITLTSLGISIGYGYAYFWREPGDRYTLSRASVQRHSAQLWLSFTSRWWPAGGTPAEIKIPVTPELVDDLTLLIPTLDTLADPPNQR